MAKDKRHTLASYLMGDLNIRITADANIGRFHVLKTRSLIIQTSGSQLYDFVREPH